jgi:hypothetical protein
MLRVIYQQKKNMDFIDQIKSISQQIQKLKDQILTEEATKNAFVMPFINALGIQWKFVLSLQRMFLD